jgi:hypothetical protein
MGAKSKAKAESDATLIPQGAPADELTANCPDLEQWPRSWMYEARDLSHAQQMVECFKPFLRHLVSSGPSRKTLRSHRDNLWILGGEIISKLHEDPRLRSARQTRSCSRSSTTKVDRSSPTGPKISNALSTRPAESSFAFSKSATREANRLSGYGHVDDARALPTCPQPQTTNTKSRPRLNHPRTSQRYLKFSASSLLN